MGQVAAGRDGEDEGAEHLESEGKRVFAWNGGRRAGLASTWGRRCTRAARRTPRSSSGGGLVSVAIRRKIAVNVCKRGEEGGQRRLHTCIQLLAHFGGDGHPISRRRLVAGELHHLQHSGTLHGTQRNNGLSVTWGSFVKDERPGTSVYLLAVTLIHCRNGAPACTSRSKWRRCGGRVQRCGCGALADRRWAASLRQHRQSWNGGGGDGDGRHAAEYTLRRGFMRE